MIGGIDSFPLLAVPFFILAGNLMNNAGITNRIYNFALALVGWLKGGLGHVNVVGSVIFAGMSGTAIADAAGLGTIEIKAMKDHGYTRRVLGRRDRRLGHAGADHSAEPAVRDLRDDGQRVGRRVVPGRHPAGRADGAADDGDGGLLRAQERLGRRHQVLGHALRQGADRDGGGRGLAAGGVLRGAGRRAAAAHGGGGAGGAVRGRPLLPVAGGAADHDAGAADRRHDHGPVHAHRRRHRGQHVGAWCWACSGTAR